MLVGDSMERFLNTFLGLDVYIGLFTYIADSLFKKYRPI